MKLKFKPKVDKNGRPINGRFLASPVVKPYVSRVLRGGPIELPIERDRRAKAEAKRARKAARRAGVA
jgi:hypothetical protein